MTNEALSAWVRKVAEYAKPEAIRWCDGSALEARCLEDRMLADGTLIRLNEATFPRSFLHRSHPSDVAATGAIGVPRNDPMAMVPFCGLNMADYLGHWLSMDKRLVHAPRIFHVNWFRTGDQGKFLWPGFGENIRVLKWILERVDGASGARLSPIGNVPTRDSINLDGLDIGPERFDQLSAVDPQEWMAEAARNGAFLERFGNRLPQLLRREHEALLRRLRVAIS
jgi:phosphoenolpyruvate carboxykinase (GTP)